MTIHSLEDEFCLLLLPSFMDYSSTYDICSGLENFGIIGINYQNADIAVRSSFAVCNITQERITFFAKEKKLKDIIVLSTCNRTEIYGLASTELLIEILCEATGNSTGLFHQHGYVYTGMDAVKHLFKVASGLDSQIIGDYEILMQLKKAARHAKDNELLGSLSDRLVNFALQASKRIKSETKLSTGTVSVAYAAIEVIRERVADIANKNILLVGAGKFGRNVARNIGEYFPGAKVRITNRTFSKAEDFAQEHDMLPVPYEALAQQCEESDILIVSTTAEDYTILPGFFKTEKPRLLLDLSVPKSIHPAVKTRNNITLMDVDEISAILNDTFAKRKAEIPKAVAIIEDTLGEFVEWHKVFLHRHFLGQVKSKLYELSEADSCLAFPKDGKDFLIQKAVKTLAVDLRSQTQTARGCQYINTMHEYLKISHS
ncbi:glutamyl-tRNA reductase [Terrimonas sp.]|uniref:glutamyl-tRNA reductase n=1 Tax=Terrimonas sp. TaxID=1914338 RepID=UPI000D51711D|nr:glutamyl-tRNA reductase [Terrimonas sp.]PVD52089.1 glutamyl-tRNA reductase [Terrimonas sp.]